MDDLWILIESVGNARSFKWREQIFFTVHVIYKLYKFLGDFNWREFLENSDD